MCKQVFLESIFQTLCLEQNKLFSPVFLVSENRSERDVFTSHSSVMSTSPPCPSPTDCDVLRASALKKKQQRRKTSEKWRRVQRLWRACEPKWVRNGEGWRTRALLSAQLVTPGLYWQLPAAAKPGRVNVLRRGHLRRLVTLARRQWTRAACSFISCAEIQTWPLDAVARVRRARLARAARSLNGGVAGVNCV